MSDINLDIDIQSGSDISINIETAPPGKPGEPGKPGDPGKDGVGIESIFQTVIGMGSGARNEWMITLTDGRTETLTIYNGESGRPASIIPAGETDDEILLEVVNAGQPSYMLRIPKGKDGKPGKDGVSPTIRVYDTDVDVTLVIKDVNGEKTVTIPKTPPPIEVPDVESPTGSGLPVVDSEDSGKVLTVVGGEWAADDALPKAVKDTEKRIDELRAGGRNLFTHTKDFGGAVDDPWNYALPYWQDTGETYEGLAVRQKSTAWDGLSQPIQTKAEEEYTLSAWVKRSEGAEVIFYAEDTNRNGTYLTDQTGADWRRIHMTFFRYSDGEIRPRLENSIDGETICICGLKLERGNIASDWTPAPEELVFVSNNANDDIPPSIEVPDEVVTREEMLLTLSNLGLAKFASSDGVILYTDNSGKVYTL